MSLFALLDYGYEFLSGFVPFMLAFALAARSYRKRGVRLGKTSIILLIVFAIYVIGVYHFTGPGTLYEVVRFGFHRGHSISINLIPFTEDIFSVGYILNIALFVPLGLLIPLMWRRLNKVYYVLPIGAAFSLFIELAQLVNARATDVDDIIMNTLGTAIGFAAYKLVERFAGVRSRRDIPVSLLFIGFLAPYLGRFLLFDEMGLARLVVGF